MWIIILTITFLLLNKRLLDCVFFPDKQQLHILFRMSQSTHFGIYFHLLLIWVPHVNFETYMKQYTTAQYLCEYNTRIKYMCAGVRTRTCKCDLHINAGPPAPPTCHDGIWTAKQTTVFCFVVGLCHKSRNCFSSNEAVIMVSLVNRHLA
jgi:hypothetical protein